jgi:poly(3-hydroxybutyrate) depolymerase
MPSRNWKVIRTVLVDRGRALLAFSALACGAGATGVTGATDGGGTAPTELDSGVPSSTWLDGSSTTTPDGGGPSSTTPDDSGTTTPPPDSGITLDGGDSASPVPPPLADGAPSPLTGLNIDLSQTSVSGFSSGGFMAVQFGVAFSSIIEGIGAFAGGPFGCSQGSATTADTQCADATSAPSVTALVASTNSLYASGAIDNPANLAAARVFLFSGADDAVVSPPVVDSAQTYFEAFMPAASIQYVSRRASTAHVMPTLTYGAACDSSDAPWIGDCGYDGAGLALGQIYGTLTAASSTATGTIATLDQGAFVSNPSSHSLDSTAYVYVPTSCASGEACRIHVAFHGCEMGASVIGSDFYLHAGYNTWADTNHIVVLYPQAIASTDNPYACWDFWGYDSAAYDTKSAPQMAMTRAMIGNLAGASGDE